MTEIKIIDEQMIETNSKDIADEIESLNIITAEFEKFPSKESRGRMLNWINAKFYLDYKEDDDNSNERASQ